MSMKYSNKFSVPSSIRGAAAIVIALAILLNFAVLYSLSIAAPTAAVCVSPTMLSVGTESELNDAIDCFNQETTAGTYVITLTQDIVLITSTMPISNTTANVDLELNGAGFSIDGDDLDNVRPLAVYTGTEVTIDDLTVTGGNIRENENTPLNHGGGIQNFGDLTIIDSNIVSNSVDSASSSRLAGGGIYNYEFATLSIINSTVSDNFADRDGGGIENRGVLTITDSTIADNDAGRFSGGIGTVNSLTMVRTRVENNNSGDSGGGIYNNVGNDESINISDSVIHNNNSNASGGGIFNDNSSGLNLSGSTLSDNTADADDAAAAGDGGAIFMRGNGFATIENTTISGNHANGMTKTGGISNTGTITLVHVSMVSNTGGINFGNSGTAMVINSVLAGGTSDCEGTLATNINNLIQTNGSCSAPDVTGDPLLDPLAANGGFGHTHLPRLGSPLINGADSNCFGADQRGVLRLGGTCEIGSVELEDTIVSIADASTTEGTGGTTTLNFTMTRSEATGPVTVTVNTADNTATAGSDYAALVNEVVGFDTGVLTKTISVDVTPDSLVESNEAFTVTLSNPINAALIDGSASGTINDDDTANLALSGPISVTEGDVGTVNYVFTATLSAEVDGGFEVDVATADGTATVADSDYDAASETLTFSGNTNETQTVTVVVNGDTTPEGNENFTVALGTITSTVPSAKIIKGDAFTGVIAEDDAPMFSITAVMTTVLEADTTVPVTVTLSESSAITTSVTLQTTDGSASAGSDYTAVNTVVEFAPGETEKVVNVSILDDNSDETDETFDIALSSPSDAILGSPTTLTMTIIDNDGTPGINIQSSTYVVDESAGALDVVLELSNSSSSPVSVTIQSSDVTALAGTDYTAISQTVVIPANQITETVSVSIINDTLYEGDETFTLQISDPVNANLSTTTAAVVTIDEDDALPKVSIGDVTQDEGNSTNVVTFTISLDKVVGVDVSVGYMTQDSSATVLDGDYSAKSGTLVIPAGQTSGTVEVTVNGDEVDEDDESFVLVLTTVTDGMLDSMLSGRTGTATLTNDDSSGVMIFLPMVVR